jgi:hypothetical protein
MPKVIDKIRKVMVVRCDLGQLLRIFESGVQVSLVAAKSNERQQDIAIVGMLFQPVSQDIHRLIVAASRMQCHRVDIGIDLARVWPLGAILEALHRIGLSGSR